ncbi:LAFA_0F05776g1_1 [Lachancea sp. 'fantastica']|nr:LAFA_0F05776g1_1 [Lachancea sp. 'fantastica']
MWNGRKNAGNSVDGDDNSGGIYKWTMDALFGRRISPSRRFKEISQDDTNYRLKRNRGMPKKWDGVDYQSSGRNRSTSVSSNRSFLQRYDLLHEEDADSRIASDSDFDFQELSNLRRNRREVPQVGKVNDFVEHDSADTFSARRQKKLQARGLNSTHPSINKDSSLKVNAPDLSDPLISKLFGKESAQLPHTNLPGKFPSPFKQAFEHPQSKRDPPPQTKDFTDDYLQLLEELDLNGQKLKQLQGSIQQHNDHQRSIEASYREKYLAVRQELIAELKQSKNIYDNYYKLYGKYKQLKSSTVSQKDTSKRIRDLESQVVDVSIERADQIRQLNETIFRLELEQQEDRARNDRERIKYQSRIMELESLLRSRLSDSPLQRTERLPSQMRVDEPRPYSETFT